MKIEYRTYINENLALILCKGEEAYCYITTNFEERLLPFMGYLAINNIPTDILNMLETKEIFKYTGKTKKSGFVDFPLVIFDFDKINEFNRGR